MPLSARPESWAARWVGIRSLGRAGVRVGVYVGPLLLRGIGRGTLLMARSEFRALA